MQRNSHRRTDSRAGPTGNESRHDQKLDGLYVLQRRHGQIANWNAVPASGGTFSLFVSTPYYYPNGQSTPVYANEGTIALSAERDTVGSGSYPLGFAFVDPATIPYTGGFIASFLIYPNETGSDRKGCIVASYKGVKFRQNFTQSGDGLPWPKGFSVAGYSTTSTHNSFYMPQAEAWYPLTINCPSGTTWSCSSTGSVLTISRTNHQHAGAGNVRDLGYLLREMDSDRIDDPAIRKHHVFLQGHRNRCAVLYETLRNRPLQMKNKTLRPVRAGRTRFRCEPLPNNVDVARRMRAIAQSDDRHDRSFVGSLL